MPDMFAAPPFNRPPYTRRHVQPGAQGVLTWHRRLAGRNFFFTFVFAGWWGVGETGDLFVRAERPGLETYSEYRYQVRYTRIADVAATEATLRAQLEAAREPVRSPGRGAEPPPGHGMNLIQKPEAP